METIRTDRVVAMIVKTFFRYFTLGIVEQDKGGMDTLEPRDIKRMMLEHYEDVSAVFNKEAFYIFARMNYDMDHLQQKLKTFITPATTYMDLVRLACKTDAFYNCMVEEYKRNFEFLLAGHLATQEEHDSMFTRCEALGVMEHAMAVELTADIMNKAYAAATELRTDKRG